MSTSFGTAYLLMLRVIIILFGGNEPPRDGGFKVWQTNHKNLCNGAAFNKYVSYLVSNE